MLKLGLWAISAFGTFLGSMAFAQTNPSVAFYYGKPVPVVELSRFDWVVVEPDNLGARGLEELQRAGVDVFAYLSLGEAAPNTVDTTWILGRNAPWGSVIVDPRSAGRRAQILARVDALHARGYRGLFLDTLDSYAIVLSGNTRRAATVAMAGLIRAIGERHPEVKLFFNRGFELMDEVGSRASAVAAESLLFGWDAAGKRYVEVPAVERHPRARRARGRSDPEPAGAHPAALRWCRAAQPGHRSDRRAPAGARLRGGLPRRAPRAAARAGRPSLGHRHLVQRRRPARGARLPAVARPADRSRVAGRDVRATGVRHVQAGPRQARLEGGTRQRVARRTGGPARPADQRRSAAAQPRAPPLVRRCPRGRCSPAHRGRGRSRHRPGGDRAVGRDGAAALPGRDGLPGPRAMDRRPDGVVADRARARPSRRDGST